MQNTRPKNIGVLGPNWEGPYRIREVLRSETYKMEELSGESIKHTWNTEHLKVYY